MGNNFLEKVRFRTPNGPYKSGYYNVIVEHKKIYELYGIQAMSAYDAKEIAKEKVRTGEASPDRDFISANLIRE